ncbi:MAG: ribosomal L7Ae/L30e/S12e/Gadd45 family protein [Firmicutes bacterium]|nr:ribosomal L7Ae/L30e/S12e/Gadd45 family protein [Bacillota bacterium]
MSQVQKAIRESSSKIIGLKQTLRAIQQNKVATVYLANDIEDHIVRKITEQCRENAIPVVNADLSQKELGRLCQIEVGAAVVGIIGARHSNAGILRENGETGIPDLRKRKEVDDLADH